MCQLCGDREGTIYLGEVKTCTVENYIYQQFTDPIQTVGNAADGIQQSSSLSQQSNNPVMQSQLNILKDIISSNRITKTNYYFFLIRVT